MYGNDVRQVVSLRAVTGIQCLHLCAIHDNTRAMYSAQDCMQIPMQPSRRLSAAGRIVGSKGRMLIGPTAKIA